MRTLFSDAALHTTQSLPPRLVINMADAPPKPLKALETNNSDSLFQLAKKEVIIDPPPPKPVERHISKHSVRDRYQWQLQIQRPTISEKLVINEVENAFRQLQAGDVSVAQRALLTVLKEDPHNVEAMEGMRLAARQLGDDESEQKYLDMLRLEIPDYDLDPHAMLTSALD